MNRPKGNFTLNIDTIIADAYLEDSVKQYADEWPLIDVPYNTMESEDNYRLYHTSDEEKSEAEDKDKI